ncbi:MAG: fused MFS/spermidine synthase, partial [Hyphomicrobiales bacterium]|nr:fused MFS/spermidine synthase [Hyphomicrobiales bacterium]
LAGFSIGHWIGGRLADTPETTAWRGLAVSLFLAALTTLAAIWLIGPLSEPILTAFPHPVAGITLFAAALFLLPSLFVGIPSPVVARLAITSAHGREGRVLGMLYAAGALGAIFGTLAAGYLFISWLGTTWTLIVVAVLYAGLAVAVAAVGMRTAALRVGAGVLGLLLVLLAVLVTPRAAIAPCTIESRYYCLRSVDMSDDIGMPARAMILDHLGHGINLGPAPQLLLVPYTSIINALVETRYGDRPISAFFIGGGAYTLPRAWASTRQEVDITVAEIDPAVTRLAGTDFWVDTTTMRVMHEDGRIALNRLADERFDVVIGDAFTDIAVPQHLITREFLALVKRRLSPGGVYLMNLVDRADRRDALAAMVATMRAVFPSVQVW